MLSRSSADGFAKLQAFGIRKMGHCVTPHIDHADVEGVGLDADEAAA
jgi:hypothetical protein